MTDDTGSVIDPAPIPGSSDPYRSDRLAASPGGPIHPRLKAFLLMLGITALIMLLSLPSGSGR